MKHNVRRIIITTIVLIAIYAAGLSVGLWVTSAMPGEWKRSNLEYAARQRMIEYESSGRVSNWSNSCIAVITYDENGRFKDFFRMDGKPFEINFLDQSTENLPVVLSGQSTLKLYPLVGNYSKMRYTSLIYIGIPMKNKETGQVEGAFFWIKDCPDLVEIMLGYIIVFTVFYLVVVIFLVLMSARERRLSKIPQRYIDNITHELKSPIASIKALTEALSDGMAHTEDEQTMYYGMILKEANRQEKMIHGVLELSRLQNFKKSVTKERISTRDFFEAAFKKYYFRCDLYGVDFIYDKEIFDMPDLYTNVMQTQHVLDILINNATKFVSEGQYVKVSAKQSRKRITVCVSDNGSGIAADELPKVFERFYKAKRNDNETGSGLGLAIAKESQESMDESIWIESKEGEGTRVYFTISLA